MSAKEDSGPRVAVGVICRHGLLLAAQRPDEKPLGGYWELPGGKLEACAPLETARTNYKGAGPAAILHFFKVLAFEGEPCGKENQNLRWVDAAEAAELDFLPADKEIIQRLFPCCANESGGAEGS